MLEIVNDATASSLGEESDESFALSLRRNQGSSARIRLPACLPASLDK